MMLHYFLNNNQLDGSCMDSAEGADGSQMGLPAGATDVKKNAFGAGAHIFI